MVDYYDLQREIALSLRMLLRHALTADIGAGVPKVDLADRIKSMDKALGGIPPSMGKKRFGRADTEKLIKIVDGTNLVDFVKTRKPRRDGPRCTIEGCGNLSRAKTLCTKHYDISRREQ
jgi:hypothetical protein